MDTPLHIRIDDGVAEILMKQRPVNGLTPELLDELLAVMRRVGDDRQVRAIVLGGAVPGRFCDHLRHAGGCR